MIAVGGELTDSFILLSSCVTTAASQRLPSISCTKGMITCVPFDTVGSVPEDVRRDTCYMSRSNKLYCHVYHPYHMSHAVGEQRNYLFLIYIYRRSKICEEVKNL